MLHIQIRIKLKGRIWIRIKVISCIWIRTVLICSWQAKIYEIWAHLSPFSRFWAFIWQLGSGSASTWATLLYSCVDTCTFFFRFSLYRFQEEGPFKGPTPKARSGHRIVYYKGSIYSFGGYNPKVLIFFFPIFEIFWWDPGQWMMDPDSWRFVNPDLYGNPVPDTRISCFEELVVGST